MFSLKFMQEAAFESNYQLKNFLKKFKLVKEMYLEKGYIHEPEFSMCYWGDLGEFGVNEDVRVRFDPHNQVLEISYSKDNYEESEPVDRRYRVLGLAV